MNKSLLDTFLCPICFDYCNNPVNSTCCEALYCKSCSENLDRCSICRSDCEFIKSGFANRLIKMIETNCEHCGYKCTRGDLEHHLKKCEMKYLTCPCEGCSEKIKQIDFMEHLNLKHKQEVMARVDILVDLFSKGNNLMDSSKNLTNFSIQAKPNRQGNIARLGANGKYYCKERLDGPWCDCCDGFCGPHSGCKNL